MPDTTLQRPGPRAVPLLFACAASLTLSGCWWDDNYNSAAPQPAPSPAPAPASYTVGGGITGLTAAGLVLANGSDTVSVATSATGFTLPTAVTQRASYAVTVQTQPAGLHCSVSNATGTIAGANVTNVAVACAPVSHTLGGTISGLPTAGLVLSNGTDTVSPAAGALSFTFAVPVAEGGAYAVAVQTQPSGATCSVGSGSGTMGTSNISNVQVTCAANSYHLSGTISGLTASGLILANGTDTASPAANATSFAFAQPVAFGGSYSVTVQQQPTGQTCSVAGTYPVTMGAGDVTNLSVSCVTATAFKVLAGREACPADGLVQLDGSGAAASMSPRWGATAFDAAGNLYFDTNEQIVKLTPGGVLTSIAGRYGVQGQQIDGTGAAAEFFGGNTPGIAADGAGNLFFSDGHQIRLATQAGVVTTLAGGIAGNFGYVNGAGTVARFDFPSGLAVDTANNVFIADSFNHAIRKMTPAGVVTTLAGGGPNAFGFVDGTGSAARFAQPEGLALDAAGNLYVADYLNNAIRKVTPAGVVTTLAGAGQANPGFVDGSGSAARFKLPYQISIDTAGNLYVTDQNQYVMRKVTPAGVVTTVAVADEYAAATGLPAPTGVVSLPISNALNSTFTVSRSGALVFPVNCAIETTGP